MAAGDPVADAFVEPGNVITTKASLGDPGPTHTPPERPPQMPAFHLVQHASRGISMINIGTGPSNARNITDHVAVLRPHAWLMLGHCAGLRNTQKLGDYVLAHGYVREDHVLDEELPLWVPVPALAEMQVALEQAVSEVTGLTGFELKREMRTGTVASVDNRNWELGDHAATIRRLSQSRAIASTWNRPLSSPMDSGSACHTERCYAYRTSRCMASSNWLAWPGTSTATASAIILRSVFERWKSSSPKNENGCIRAS
jgi:AMP nucleosidase